MSTIQSGALQRYGLARTRRNRRDYILLIGVALGMLISACQPIQPIQPLVSSGSAFVAPAPPQSLEELVEDKPLIIWAFVGPVVRQLDFATYDADGALATDGLAADGSTLPPSPSSN